MIPSVFTDYLGNIGASLHLIPPVVLALAIAGCDLKTRRIPNYLTLGTAVAGLGFQLGSHGWTGLADGLLGLALGFGFLILPYIWGGVGAGDVKALAALGAWLNPFLTFSLVIYMAICGGVMALALLWWKGLLWAKIRHSGSLVLSWVLSHPQGGAAFDSGGKIGSLPYGVALASGMLILFLKGA